jgi:hypothetical protein
MNKKVILTLIGIIIGAVAGYLYYLNIGCESGTCAITSKPVNSIMGGLIFNMFVKTPKKE